MFFAPIKESTCEQFRPPIKETHAPRGLFLLWWDRICLEFLTTSKKGEAFALTCTQAVNKKKR